MSYDAIIEEVRSIPENRLAELLAFIGYLKFSSDVLEKQKSVQISAEIPSQKKAFFDAVGKLSFDKAAVEKMRNENMI